MAFELDDAKLAGILAEVEQELVPVLKNEQQKLSKAKDESAPPAEETSEEGSAPPTEGSSPPAEGSGEAPPPPPAPEASAEGSAPPTEGSSPPAEASGGLPTDPNQLAQMVAGLPPETLKALYLAAKQALFAQMGGGAEGSAPPAPAGPGPEASAPAPSPAPAGPPVPPMGKGEMKPSQGNGGKQAAVKKNERMAQPTAEVDELKALIKKQDEKFALLEKALTLSLQQPVRKAVTGISHIAKSEQTPDAKPLTKGELTTKLKEKARDPQLSKSDRDAINRFYNTGSTDLKSIEHLLK